jgi:hypothetical protein
VHLISTNKAQRCGRQIVNDRLVLGALSSITTRQGLRPLTARDELGNNQIRTRHDVNAGGSLPLVGRLSQLRKGSVL